MSGVVRIEDDPTGYRTILLDRPSSRNAIDRDVVDGLQAGITEAPGPVVLLGSTDPRAFSSGADIALDDRDRVSVSDSLYALYLEMRASPKIIIAAASGHAVGGGAQLLIASDLRIGSHDLIVRFMGPGHGLVVGAWGLPSLVGRGRAVDLCLSMRPVAAEEARAIGLVDRLADDPLRDAAAYAAEICGLDVDAVRAVKRITAIPSPADALSEERARNSSWDGSIPKRE